MISQSSYQIIQTGEVLQDALLLGSEAEWRELKRKRINDALEALGLPKTHWLNKDEKMDESKAKAKDALQDAIKDEEQEELNSELENLKISKELAVKSSQIKIFRMLNFIKVSLVGKNYLLIFLNVPKKNLPRLTGK
jgi:hypothetical protein